MWKMSRKPAGGKPCSEEAAELIRGMAKGDEAALECLYDTTAARTYAFVLRIVRDEHAAEEVIEDAYFQAWRQADRFDPARGNPMAWLYTLCRSRALDHLRRVEHRETAEDPAAFETLLGSDENDPFHLMDSMQRSGRVHEALASLSPQARQLVSLAFFRGLSHTEIAEASRMPLGTVKTTIKRACDKMRIYLSTQAGVTP